MPDLLQNLSVNFHLSIICSMGKIALLCARNGNRRMI